eukprot:tig00020510_g9894.t1
MHLLARAGELAEAESLLRRAPAFGVPRNAAVYSPIVRDAAYGGEPDLLDRLLALMREDGLVRPQKGTKLQSSLSISLLIFGRVEEAAGVAGGGTPQACWDVCHAIENALFWPDAFRAALAAYGLPPGAPHTELSERMAARAAAAGLLSRADPAAPQDWFCRALMRAESAAEVAALHAAVLRVYRHVADARLTPAELLPWAECEAAANAMTRLVQLGLVAEAEAYGKPQLLEGAPRPAGRASRRSSWEPG